MIVNVYCSVGGSIVSVSSVFLGELEMVDRGVGVMRFKDWIKR